MSLTTHSRFYFGHTVDDTNFALDFNEGGAELQASLNVGGYSLEEFATEVERALNEAGALTYTVTVNRTTRKITVAASGTFALLVSSGSRVGTDCFDLLGFTGADQTAAATYTADSASGSEYVTQFILQSFVDSSDFIKGRMSTVNQSASGETEVFKYGDDAFYEMNFTYLTDRTLGATSPIRNNATGISEIRTLLNYMRTKAHFEFMPDEDDVSTYSTVVLESTPDEKTGVGFKLKELFSQKLPGFFETGVITLRDVSP